MNFVKNVKMTEPPSKELTVLLFDLQYRMQGWLLESWLGSEMSFLFAFANGVCMKKIYDCFEIKVNYCVKSNNEWNLHFIC